MALPIKSVPELKGKVAERFIQGAEENSKNKRRVNFVKEFENYLKIIEKWKM